MATRLNLESTRPKGTGKPDWFKELEDLTLPILRSIREMTEKPRTIDALKYQTEVMEAQIPEYELAHKHLLELKQLESNTGGKAADGNYLQRLQDLLPKYDPEVLKLKIRKNRENIERLSSSDKSLIETVTDEIRNFFKNRGRNLIVTGFTFFGLWWILTRIRKWVVGTRLLSSLSPGFSKLFSAGYNLFAITFCLAAAMGCLFFFNDWLLISVLVMILLLGIWTSRQWIPKFLKEIKFILNLGTVREGERIIWQGIPWQVVDIGLFATLNNERLQGGEIKLQVSELIGLHSRPVFPGEPWFPTRPNDWVLLADGSYGRVENQTLEQVVLVLKGGSKKYFSTIDFLHQNPVNFSDGFRYCIEFRLEYSLQDKICNEIPALFAAGLRKKLHPRFEGSAPEFSRLSVTFDHADSSALNLAVIVHLDGRCAEFHEELKREIQGTLVQICNENGFVIPNERLTINLARGEDESSPLALREESPAPKNRV